MSARVPCGRCGRLHTPPVKCARCGYAVNVCEIKMGPGGADDLWHERDCWRVPGKRVACGPLRI